MPLNLAHLPHDIIIQISTHLHPRDLLSFLQTCRVIHALGSTDYVWHHMNNVDLPIDGRLTHASGSEIRASVVRALRLDENWKRRVSKINRISKINHRHAVVDMQPLGREWLVVSSRAPNYTINIALWHLLPSPTGGIASSSCVASYEPGQAFSFEAAFEDEDFALISVLGASPLAPHKARLTVYRINLKGSDLAENPLHLPHVTSQHIIDHSGVFYHSQVCGPIVGAAVAHVSPENCSHQILLFNTQTKAAVRMESSILNSFDTGRMQFKLYSRHIVVVGVCHERVKVLVREIPGDLFMEPTASGPLEEDTIPSMDWAFSIVDYQTPMIRNLEFFISPEPVDDTSLDSFTIMVTHTPFSTMDPGNVNIFRFPIDTTKRDQNFIDWEPAYTFPTLSNATMEPTCLGKTGRRAVWLSHQWNVDVFTLMKASFGDIVAPLHAADQALPFQPHTCQSLFFEEATGRLFVGVHTGEIYVLEY